MKNEANTKTMEEIMRTYYDTVVGHSQGDADLIGTRFESLDCYIRGLKNGELMLVFGASAMGKTSFILQCAKNLSEKGKKSVLLFSPENPACRVAERMIMADSGIRQCDLYKGSLIDTEWLDLLSSCKALSETGITVSDGSYLPFDRLAATVEKEVRNKKADIILIDSLDFLGYNENTDQKIRALKNIAFTYNVPVICSCKISHRVKSENTYIRKAGEHADVSIKLWRDLYKDNGRSKETYFLIKKNSKGSTGEIIMIFDLDRLIFKEQYEQEII